jgi:hypothetical protein
MKFLLSILLLISPWLFAEPLPPDIVPSQTRLLIAQAKGGADAAVSSQAVATQPDVPTRVEEATPPKPAVPTPKTPAAPPTETQILDPRLDPDRPINSQLNITFEQTLQCDSITVVIPAGTYEQKLVVDNPTGRHAIDGTNLKPQQIGLGYIRYASDIPIKVNGVSRGGGLDIPIRKEDNLPVRIWYKKMSEVDDWTKAFTFILPPVGLIAGAGAWSSGNILLPDSPPKYTEARDYYLKKELAEQDGMQIANPAVRLTPSASKSKAGLRVP